MVALDHPAFNTLSKPPFSMYSSPPRCTGSHRPGSPASRSSGKTPIPPARRNRRVLDLLPVGLHRLVAGRPAAATELSWRGSMSSREEPPRRRDRASARCRSNGPRRRGCAPINQANLLALIGEGALPRARTPPIPWARREARVRRNHQVAPAGITVPSWNVKSTPGSGESGDGDRLTAHVVKLDELETGAREEGGREFR